MDESMNSVHSISAMDISPASSPKTLMNPISSNHLLLNAFHQQHELLSNALFNTPNMNRISNECDTNSKSMCLFSTVLSDNNDESMSDETNQIRKRIITEPAPVVNEPISTTKTTSESNSSKRLFNKSVLFIPIVLIVIYFIAQYFKPAITVPRSSSWQNASEYLTQNLIGQDHGLEQFKDAMNTHKNFSIVLIEGSTGTGKTYLASSLEKFIPTTLLSANTLLGLSPHRLTDSNELQSYFLSNLSPSLFQFLIIDDLDLLPTNETYCQTLTTALDSLNNHKNLFILLLQTKPMSDICKEYFNNIVTKSIQFNMLNRDHIRICIQNEAYIQNVQPSFDNEQIETILSKINYVVQQDVLYSITGCKQIPSFVILASRSTRPQS